MGNTATIEIFRGGQWRRAATVRVEHPERGIESRSTLEYDMDYAINNTTSAKAAAISCAYPVDMDLHNADHWPPFLLDIVPSGFGREQWLRKLDIRDGLSADWPLLLNGAAFPPGNLRIREAVEKKSPETPVYTADGTLVPAKEHPGFSLDDVLRSDSKFVEYAHECGIYVGGSSDAGGVAPKMLLAESHDGRWHAEGVLADRDVRQCWLLKRPRGKTQSDNTVLRNEAAYMRFAHELKLKVHAELKWKQDKLLIPRFDRLYDAGVSERLGMESLCSLAGVARFGAAISNDDLCAALLEHSTDPQADLIEYIKRDALNIAMRNTDNHARNHAVLKWPDGTVRLSPLFDFAPMYLDAEGITRTCRWEGERELGGRPVWQKVVQAYTPHAPQLVEEMRALGARLADGPALARQAGIEDPLIDYLAEGMDSTARALMALEDI